MRGGWEGKGGSEERVMKGEEEGDQEYVEDVDDVDDEEGGGW